jgi:hypothetical protein
LALPKRFAPSSKANREHASSRLNFLRGEN